MRQQGGGSMVNLISTQEVSDFSNGSSAYAASRAGLMGLTCAAASELAAYQIRVNSICYGAGDLGLELSEEWDSAAFDRWNRAFPDGLPGNTSKLVKLVLFLCSEESAYMNGQVLPAYIMES